MARKQRTLWQRVADGLWVLLALVIVGELAVRLYESVRFDAEIGALISKVVFHEDYYTLEPGTRLVQPERYGDILYSGNQLGFRDLERGSKRDATRVLFLGDSVTFGLGVADDETFPRLIETALNRTARRAQRFEAVNLALFGYSAVNQVAVLREVGLPLEPDLIVLQLHMNDFYAGERSSRVGGNPDNRATRLRAAARVVVNSSALYRRVRQARQMLTYTLLHDLRRRYFAGSLSTEGVEHHARLFEEHPDDAEFESFRVLPELLQLAAQRRIPLVVILTPSEVQLHRDEWDGANERIGAFFRARGIEFHDLLGALRGLDDKIGIFNDGLHLDARGNEAARDFLLPIIQGHLGDIGGIGGGR